MLYGRNKLPIAQNRPQEASNRPSEASETPESLRRKSKNHENDRFWASDPRNGFPGQIEVFPGSSGCYTAEISSQPRKIVLKRPQTGPQRPLKHQNHLGENRKIEICEFSDLRVCEGSPNVENITLCSISAHFDRKPTFWTPKQAPAGSESPTDLCQKSKNRDFCVFDFTSGPNRL